jgi:hypothetical protein
MNTTAEEWAAKYPALPALFGTVPLSKGSVHGITVENLNTMLQVGRAWAMKVGEGEVGMGRGGEGWRMEVEIEKGRGGGQGGKGRKAMGQKRGKWIHRGKGQAGTRVWYRRKDGKKGELGDSRNVGREGSMIRDVGHRERIMDRDRRVGGGSRRYRWPAR